MTVPSFINSQIISLQQERSCKTDKIFYEHIWQTHALNACPYPRKMMKAAIYFGIILLSFDCCCHLLKLCSSHFKFSLLKQSHEDFKPITKFKAEAETELRCALRSVNSLSYCIVAQKAIVVKSRLTDILRNAFCIKRWLKVPLIFSRAIVTRNQGLRRSLRRAIYF